MKKIFATISLALGATFFGFAEETPSFPGGESALTQYIAKNTVYPEYAKENGVEGIVTVGFMVMADGTLNSVKAENFVDPDLEKEAVRVVSGMPSWIPAEKDGSPVEAPAKVEVPFILD